MSQVSRVGDFSGHKFIGLQIFQLRVHQMRVYQVTSPSDLGVGGSRIAHHVTINLSNNTVIGLK